MRSRRHRQNRGKEQTGQQRRLVGALAAEALPLPPLDLRSPGPLPLEALRGWQGVVQIAVQVRALIDCQNAALAMTQIAVISRTFRTRKSRSECRWSQHGRGATGAEGIDCGMVGG